MQFFSHFNTLKRLFILSTLLIGVPASYVLYDIRKLPWQKSKFDTVFAASPVIYQKNNVLIFYKTNGYRHQSIKAGIEAITNAGVRHGWHIQATENGASFNSEYLNSFKVVVFLSTTGDILTPQQKKAFEQYIENGGGYAGIHSASDTEHEWVWYDKLLGTHFKSHTLFPRHIVDAEIITEIKEHIATRHLPKYWTKEDEWYNFKNNVRRKDNIQVLLSLNDESYLSIFPKSMGIDHPISWINVIGKGRIFYTAMGHNAETFTDQNALQHIIGGIQWAGNLSGK